MQHQWTLSQSGVVLSLTAVRHQKSIDGVVISKSPLGAAQDCVCVCFFLLDCVQGRPTAAAQMGYYLYKSARALFLSCWLCLVQRHRRVSFLVTFRGQKKKKNLAILFFCHPSPWRCPFAFQVWLEGRTKIHKFFFFWVRSRFIYLQNDPPPPGRLILCARIAQKFVFPPFGSGVLF